MATVVLLPAHGTVESLDELPGFLANIRRGQPPSAELLHEVTSRYQAIGGRSPLNDLSRAAAAKLEARLGLPVRIAGRLWKPYPSDVLTELQANVGALSNVVVLPLAQHSASIYVDHVAKAVAELGLSAKVTGASDWGQNRTLNRAFARRIVDALTPLSAEERAGTRLILSAHSLPKFLIDQGDAYEREFRAACALVLEEVGATYPDVDAAICFQSQGMSTGPGGRPMVWLGPTLLEGMTAARDAGKSGVIIASIGFLADHVEVLYDLDHEAKHQAAELGLRFARTASLNADDDFIDALEEEVRKLL